MLRVAVVEDETEYRGLIQEMVGRYAKNMISRFRLQHFRTAESWFRIITNLTFF